MKPAIRSTGDATLRLEKLAKPDGSRSRCACRAGPSGAAVTVNGKPVEAVREGGYAIVTRRWKPGDTVSIDLPLELRIEATPDDPDTIAILRGPMVLAADLGAGASDLTTRSRPRWWAATCSPASPRSPAHPASYTVPEGVARPGALRFAPFYRLYDRRTAVYFRRFTEATGRPSRPRSSPRRRQQRDLAARSVDVMHLGEMQPERDHKLTSEISYPVSYRGRNGRDARSGGFFEFDIEGQARGRVAGDILG